jgi:hypothetical protein
LHGNLDDKPKIELDVEKEFARTMRRLEYFSLRP